MLGSIVFFFIGWCLAVAIFALSFLVMGNCLKVFKELFKEDDAEERHQSCLEAREKMEFTPLLYWLLRLMHYCFLFIMIAAFAFEKRNLVLNDRETKTDQLTGALCLLLAFFILPGMMFNSYKLDYKGYKIFPVHRKYGMMFELESFVSYKQAVIFNCFYYCRRFVLCLLCFGTES
jgi:hypothetical protein